MHEELLIGVNVVGTEHPMIMRAREEKLDWVPIREFLTRLEAACDSHDIGGVLRILGEVVSGYSPDARPADGTNASAAERLRVIQGGRAEDSMNEASIQPAAS